MKKLNTKQLDQNRRKLVREKEKKEYLAQMGMIADILGGKGTFALVPHHVKEDSYHSRVLPLKVISDNPLPGSEKSLYEFQYTLNRALRLEYNTMEISGRKVDLGIFMTSGFNFLRIISLAQELPDPWALELASRFKPGLEIELTNKAFYICHSGVALLIYLMYIKLEKHMFWMKFDLVSPHEGSSQILNEVRLYEEPVQMRQFCTPEGSRPAFRVFWPKTQVGIMYAEMIPSLMGAEHPDDEPVPVYIQRHALRRLQERMDCLDKAELQLSLFDSFDEPIVIRQTKNKALISYNIMSTKMGYFAAEFIDGAVLIHTFLFITNNGTPEGKKLNDLTGLGMLDKKYLALDKLSSFMSSDISRNERLKDLFEKAGCRSLLQIEEVIKLVAKKHEELAISDQIIKYLGIENHPLIPQSNLLGE